MALDFLTKRRDFLPTQTELIPTQPRRAGLLGIEWATLAYTFLTALLVVLFRHTIHDPAALLTGRLVIVAVMVALVGLHRLWPCGATRFVRVLFPLTLLAYWYPDTYEFCQLLPNLDHVFARADLVLFGGQPSLAFSRALPQKAWSEIFHLGYLAYYPMIALTVLSPLATSRRRYERAAFIVLAGFLIYYAIYLFVPVAGPQYYFQAVGTEAVEAGRFPALGDYFRFHTEMRPSPGPDGLFHDLVEATQEGGERPTAAFPSSHVGMSTILMLLLWRDNRRMLLAFLPFYVALCCATVYIEAHYLIDVFGGLVSAVLIYALCDYVYRRWVFAADSRI